MNISKQTALLVKAAKADLGEIGVAYGRAMEKREEKSSTLSETTKSFNGRESFAIGKLVLTDAEQLACQLVAFDKAMEKTVKAWGTMDYSLPETLGENLPKVFPFAKPASVPTPTPTVPATA